MQVKITGNFEKAAARFEERAKKRLATVTAHALNNQAFAARAAVQAEMRKVFRDPEPATLNSVRVRKAKVGLPIPQLSAEVYIADDLPKGSVQPATYLKTEESGGLRANKRGERVLLGAGILLAGQQVTPGRAAPLDTHGQLSGPGMVQILSRLRAFGQQGYTANANDATRKRLVRAAKAQAGKAAREAGADAAGVRAARAGAFAPIVARTGNEFFLMKSRLSEGWGAVFKLAGRGRVEPVLWFTTKRPSYKARFPFREIVRRAAAASWKDSLARALKYIERDAK